MINCTITSPKKTTPYRELQSVVLPAFSGEMQVLAGHAESFVLLKEGDIIFNYQNGQKEALKIEGGECHIKNNNAIVII
jgi:F0F1-type ATP synthase epsilon subunit